MPFRSQRSIVGHANPFARRASGVNWLRGGRLIDSRVDKG